MKVVHGHLANVHAALLRRGRSGRWLLTMDFAQLDIGAVLDEYDAVALDGLDFGVISMTHDGVIDRYNAHEAKLSGLPPARVIGKHLFTEVAPCTNNYLVASRFEESAVLDESIPYVFTLRMRPRNVELRLLKAQGSERQYLLVRNR